MAMMQRIEIGRVMDAIERGTHGTDNPGFCLFCGEEVDGVEPDAREYRCECCGERGVYGAEEVLMMGMTIEKKGGDTDERIG